MGVRCSSNDGDDSHHRHPKEQTWGCEKAVGEVANAKQNNVFYYCSIAGKGYRTSLLLGA